MTDAHRSAALALLLVAAAVGCSDAPSAAGPGHAELRVVNGATTPVEVWADGMALLGRLEPATISPVLPLAPGSRRLELRPIGGGTAATTQLEASTAAPLLVAALGTTTGSVSAVALADTGAIPAPGTAKLQAVHLAAKAPAIYVWRKQADFPTPVTFMFPHPYGASTSYIQAPPGTWEVYVTPAGATSVTASNTLAHIAIPIAANQARRVAVLDSANTVRIVPLDTP
ncbi:protein of unknown function DUF4397 [Gemmatirosa kalamazoonensis]|uniref:DUF4397 domain-containing protein n=1 Tax=Gemmatirosa kalamazoonensis TaxID=861299 RepID=W0RD42_9BACT|nr:DUF4397 domain-containing protein [Gemmatirosa kalamazoonensis]AHG89044.1 protein of unknown function DUF4397 [Gemmatirosa kalamazoonensis]